MKLRGCDSGHHQGLLLRSKVLRKHLVHPGRLQGRLPSVGAGETPVRKFKVILSGRPRKASRGMMSLAKLLKTSAGNCQSWGLATKTLQHFLPGLRGTLIQLLAK